MATDSEIRAWQRLVGATDDGRPGPKTFEATVRWLNERGHITREAPATDQIIRTRANVVGFALGQLGEQDPRKYYADAAPQFMSVRPNDIAWCGIFWLWCLRQAGLTDRVWTTGRGFAYGYLPTVSIPEPGDGMYFGGKLQHYAVVERVQNGVVYTVEGNTMTAPREGVTAKSHPIDAVKPGGGCYFSIRNLVRP